MSNPETDSTLYTKAWIIALVIVLIGLFERSGLGEFWINPDEGIDYSVATTENLQEAMNEALSNAHPPLIYLVLRSMSVISDDIVWLRLPSLIAGLFVIYGMFLLGREVGGSLCGLFAALGMVWLPELVVQSQLLRPYMLQMAFMVYALLFVMRSVRDTSRKNLALYSLFISLAVLTHYSSFIVLGGIGLVLTAHFAWRRFERAQVIALMLAHILPVVIGLVLYQFHLKQHIIGGGVANEVQGELGWMSPYFIGDPSEAWQGLMGVMALLFGYPLSGPVTAILILGVLGMGFSRKFRPRGPVVLLVVGVFIFALLFSAMRQYAFGASRHSVYLAPIVVLSLSASLAGLLRLGSGPALGGCAAILFCLPFAGSITESLAAEEHLINAEQLTPWQDFVHIEEQVLEPLKETSGVVMMNLQSYYVLLPSLHGAQEQRIWGRNFFAVPWGQSVLLVNMAWGMTSGSTGLEKNNHLLNFVSRIEEKFPELNIRERDDAWMFAAGWYMPLADGLIYIDSKQPKGQKLLDAEGSIRFSGVRAFQWDLRTYIAVVEKILEGK